SISSGFIYETRKENDFKAQILILPWVFACQINCSRSQGHSHFCAHSYMTRAPVLKSESLFPPHRQHKQ
ncbi:unnamed protein product, partial [Gulo gulo]